MAQLNRYIPSPVVAVATLYNRNEKDQVDVYICGANVNGDDSLELIFANGHGMKTGDLITIHLDNRTGVAEYDADLSVYRLSYKGLVHSIEDKSVMVEPEEFQVFYGISVEYEFKRASYAFPVDRRVSKSLPATYLTQMPTSDPDEEENKVGVLVTKAGDRPHTTVMAFLSSTEDDIFFITLPNTFKSQLMKKDNECYFAIDNRATFTFEHAIEWNYSIIKGRVYDIPKDSPLFDQIREAFIAKNPWEVGFFSHPEIEMFHLAAVKVVCPAQAN